jgi:hypothetical protein
MIPELQPAPRQSPAAGAKRRAPGRTAAASGAVREAPDRPLKQELLGMSSRVHAFPSSKHRTMVDTIAHGMAASASVDDAEQKLIAFLEIHWDRLEGFGVECDEIEVECRMFAKAAWKHYEKLRQEKILHEQAR